MTKKPQMSGEEFEAFLAKKITNAATNSTYYMISPEILEGFWKWVVWGIPTGGFLTAVLENNLKEAVGRADEENIQLLRHIVSYVVWEIPAPCHGSPERMREWQNFHEAALDDAEATP